MENWDPSKHGEDRPQADLEATNYYLLSIAHDINGG